MNEKNVNSARLQVRPQAVPPMIDIKQIWALAVINWKWFVASVFVSVLIAGAYLWFTPTKVTVTGKMEIIDKSKNNSSISAGMAMLNSLPMGLGSALGGSLGGSLGIESEKEIVLSSSLVRNVVQELGLYTEYYKSSWGRNRLLYKDQPVNVEIDNAHLQWMDREIPLSFHKIQLTIEKNSDGYTVNTVLKKNKKKTKLPEQKFVSLPATVKTEAGVLTLTENKLISTDVQEDYADGYILKVTILPPLEAANNFIKQLTVDPPTKKINNILCITLKDESPVRAVDFVNHLVDAYNERANADKNEEARKTDEFVNARLAKVDSELGSSDAAWEEYKKKFQITDPKVDAQEVMTKKSLYESQLVKLGTQLQLQDYLSEYVNNPSNLFEIIPISVGSASLDGDKGGQSAVLDVSAITRHNTLVSHRKELLKSMSDKAPQVQRITETIEELHPDIVTALARNRQSILIQKQSVQREYDHYMSKVGSTPQQERALTEIGRQREIKQGVYLVMLQKREETAMELANVADKGKLIDVTQMNKDSKTPRPKMVLVAALFVGLFLPLCVLILLYFINSKIEIVSDFKSIIKHPFLCVVSLNDNGDAIRTLRTKILLQLEPGQKVVLLTSNNEEDGKSYLAKRLVDSFAVLDKNAVLCPLNLRTSGSVSSFVDFLNNQGFSWPGVQNLHPADILASDNFSLLLAKLKDKYDYIILDSPSIDKYTDANQIAAYADLTCFVVKSGVTEKSAIAKIDKESNFPKLSYVLNSVDMNKRKMKYFFKHSLSISLVALLLTSCGSSEKIIYLDNANQVRFDSSKTLFDARIMPKDILSITVSTINPEAAKPFNLIVPTVVAGEITTTTTQPVMQSYLVNNDGTIDYPIIGVIKVGGLTKTECEKMILEKIRPYLAESEKPIVTVRMSSYSIAVLGEVKNPGSFPVSREKINIFEALAIAGDMTIYGVRDRVRLIREDASGKKEIHMLDLTDANIINSPYYYLQQNDMVYVEPSKVKKQDARVGSMTNLWFSATSILVSLASIIVTIAK